MNSDKRVTFDLDRIFSLSVSKRCYSLSEQEIEALLNIFPQAFWETRWHGSGGKTPDEIRAFFSSLANKLMLPDDCTGCEDGDCISYPSDTSIISYFPQNPYSQTGYVPTGYLTSPFTRFADYPLIGFLSTYFPDFTEELIGYLPDDIIVDLSSFPIVANWQQTLNGELPRISVAVSGNGTIELHLINFPLGGRAVVTIDTLPSLVDIFGGIIGDAEYLVELNRDIVAIPPETVSVSIFEVEINDEVPQQHTIHITFLPVIDDAAIPFNFGGGLRKVVLCGLDEVIMPIVEEVRLNNCQLEQKINGIWMAVGDVNACVTAITDPMQLQININSANIASNDSDIAALQVTAAQLQQQITNNDTDILNLQNKDMNLQQQITDNDTDIATLFASLLTTNGYVNDNATDIATLFASLLTTNGYVNDNATDIADHETRIAILEAAIGSGGSGGSVVKATPYIVYNATDFAHSQQTWVETGIVQPHTFTHDNALILMEFRGQGASTTQVGQFRMALGGVPSDKEAYVRGIDHQSVQVNDVYSGLAGQTMDLTLQVYSAAGSTKLVQYQNVMIFILEYGQAQQQPQLVDFDGGLAYTSQADGSIQPVGNGGNAWQLTNVVHADGRAIVIDFFTESGQPENITDIVFDMFSSNPQATLMDLYADPDPNPTPGFWASGTYMGGSANAQNFGCPTSAWFSYSHAGYLPGVFPQLATTVRVVMYNSDGIGQYGDIADLRIDNLRIVY